MRERSVVVREQEAQGLTRQHALVDGRDLMRERFDDRSVNGKDRIK
jgi:hypothetical protein